MVIIVLELLLISNKGIVLFRAQEGQAHFGELLQYNEIMATFASPIIVLFLGGFLSGDGGDQVPFGRELSACTFEAVWTKSQVRYVGVDADFRNFLHVYV
ncbi:hypothetical protein P4S64_12010 [Vibrio sp. M60_M31a]